MQEPDDQLQVANEELLRVVWIVPGFPASLDDPSYVFIAREAEELTKTGIVQLTILTDGGQDHPLFDVRQLVRPNRLLARVWMGVWCALRYPKYALRAARDQSNWVPALWRLHEINGHLRDLQPDVVHSHFAYPGGTGAVRIGRSIGARTVVSLRGVDLIVDRELPYGLRLKAPFDQRLRDSLPDVDVCLTATNRMRELAIAAGAPPHRCEVLPNSYRASAPADVGTPIHDLDVPEGTRIVLSVGHLIPRKGFDLGIAALAELPQDIHYVIIGRGAHHDALLAMAGALGVDRRLHLLGEVAPADARRWMATAHCYWFLSRQEAFGNVVIEAFAAGLPIVASQRGTAPELLAGDLYSRMLADPVRPDDLASCTDELLGRPRAPDTLAEDRAEKLASYSPDIRTTRLIDVYRAHPASTT